MCPTENKFSLEIPRMGYILAVRSDNSWVSNMIAKEQRKRGFSIKDSMYTHVEVMGGGPHSIKVAPPKTRIIKITKDYKGRYVKILKYNHTTYATKRYKVAFWAASHCNLVYDFFGVLKFKIHQIFHWKNSYLCSDNVGSGVQKEYPYAHEWLDPHQWMPAHCLDPKFFTVVWEGVIQ